MPPRMCPTALAACLFRGFADPTRLAVLLALLGGERRVADLVESGRRFPVERVWQLACLRESGLLSTGPASTGRCIARGRRAALAVTGNRIELCPEPADGSCSPSPKRARTMHWPALVAGCAPCSPLCPSGVTARRNGDEVEIDPGQLAVGDVVVVRPGERLATDGVVRRDRYTAPVLRS
jgi:hypothetical protein